MARTLVISDLHLGAYAGLSVLESPSVREALLRRLHDVDRLVLLGDVLELGQGRPPREVLAVAAPLLSGLGRHVREILLVPGNHDRLLIRPWLMDQGEGLALENAVPLDASALMTKVAEQLGSAGADVSVHYPALRLSERVWMTHGHYLDRVLVPDGPYGIFRRPAAPNPSAYESLQIHQHRSPAVKLTHRALTPRVARLTAAALGLQMRRHSLPALAAVLGAFDVRADYVVFGHIHRLGPLAGDRPRHWEHVLRPGQPPTRFVNTGSWQLEPLLIGRRRPPHPYWPGGSVAIDDDGIPHAAGLLDDLDFAAAPMPRARTR